MSYWINVLLNNIKVVKNDTHIQVMGLRTFLFFKEMKRVFGTTRFQTGMMTNVTSTSFSISLFFLYDFYDLLKALEEQGTAYYRRDFIVKMIQELEKLPDIQRTKKSYPSKLDISQLNRFKFKPLPHQSDFFEEYDQKTQQFLLNGYILASIPGSGKTVSSLMLQAMLNKDIVIVFSPKNALNEVWKDTLAEVKGAVTWVYPQPIENKAYTHYVFNHENTRYAKEALTEIFKKNKNSNIGIIVDECHKFTELNAEQTNNLIDICKMSGSKDILFMSGTPFKALGTELLPFLMSTDPIFTEEDRLGFRKIFGVSSTAARAILAARIGRVLFKVEKADVINNDVTTYTVKVAIKNGERFTLSAIKVKMQQFVTERYSYYTKMNPELIKQYEDILQEFSKSDEARRNPQEFERYKQMALIVREARSLREVKDEIRLSNLYEKTKIIPTLSPGDKVIFRNVKSVYKYLSLKIQGEALGQVLGAERTACNMALVREIDSGRIYSEKGGFNGEPWTLDDIFTMSKTKVVMFTDFIEVVKQTETVLRSKGYEPALVYGETNKDLSGILKRVESDPKVNPIVATFKSLSTAVPLTIADSCVLLNVPYRDYIYQQTTARIDRIGQKHPIHVYQYQLDTGSLSNISTRSYDIMAWSKKMVDELLGIDTDVDESEVEEELLLSLREEPVIQKTSLMKKWMSS